ncbi:Ctr copper transporter family protein [Glarea lozoyensis ATCC 20868]|uniref:Copper transport protein n=1 Tax=Glarea lozoyensis (strain ATCC 20868 / MF5171) TaxID=1116229 RepID=S3D0B6_GLAL2|nr:Ctr copper transporter family protein [Glarea lozoyensis ATCC 20868]EPE31967.1 Ctr copper transporter family protein [Glarea lozoyensis ATCC 20868]
MAMTMDMAATTASSMAMDMAATTAAMSGMVMPTTTDSMGATASSMPTMSMEGMGDGCKISMLWNWNTIDSCFISSSWRITSSGMFAGSCIGVILLVMSLEFFRRLSREYDALILRQSQKSHDSSSAIPPALVGFDDMTKFPDSSSAKRPSLTDADDNAKTPVQTITCAPVKFRPNLFQQMIRATLHMVQFTIAYFVMLLAMYYNGYIIICIIIGAWIGSFVFSWEGIILGDGKKEATYCCG